MNDKLILQELIDLLAARHQMEPQDADAFVKAFWALVEEGLKHDNYVKIKGLGTFKLIETEARESIDVHSGERIEIQSHARITFSPDANLRDQINRPFAHFETVILNEGIQFDSVDDKSDGLEEELEENVSKNDEIEEVEAKKEKKFPAYSEKNECTLNIPEEEPAVKDEVEAVVSSDFIVPEEEMPLVKEVVEKPTPAESERGEEESEVFVEETVEDKEVDLSAEQQPTVAIPVQSQDNVAVPVASTEDVASEGLNPEVEVLESTISTSEVQSVVSDTVRVRESSTDSQVTIEVKIESQAVPEIQVVTNGPEARIISQTEEIQSKSDIHFGDTEVDMQEESVLSEKEDVVAEDSTESLSDNTQDITDTVSSASKPRTINDEAALHQRMYSLAAADTDNSSKKESWFDEPLPDKKKRYPWCMIATVLFVGIILGGIVSWGLMSGRRYIPESMVDNLVKEEVSKSMEKEDSHQVAVSASSEKAPLEDAASIEHVAKSNHAEKSITHADADKTQTASVSLPALTNKEEPAKAIEKPANEKPKNLKDNVKYKITGTMGVHTVRKGDNLARVSMKYYGNKKLWPYIVKYNRKIIKNPDNVPIGTQLQIPQLAP